MEGQNHHLKKTSENIIQWSVLSCLPAERKGSKTQAGLTDIPPSLRSFYKQQPNAIHTLHRAVNRSEMNNALETAVFWFQS